MHVCGFCNVDNEINIDQVFELEEGISAEVIKDRVFKYSGEYHVLYDIIVNNKTNKDYLFRGSKYDIYSDNINLRQIQYKSIVFITLAAPATVKANSSLQLHFSLIADKKKGDIIYKAIPLSERDPDESN